MFINPQSLSLFVPTPLKRSTFRRIVVLNQIVELYHIVIDMLVYLILSFKSDIFTCVENITKLFPFVVIDVVYVFVYYYKIYGNPFSGIVLWFLSILGIVSLEILCVILPIYLDLLYFDNLWYLYVQSLLNFFCLDISENMP